MGLAQEIARQEVDFVLAKTRFFEHYGDRLNDRQAKLVSRVLAEGRKGFEGGNKHEKIPGDQQVPQSNG